MDTFEKKAMNWLPIETAPKDQRILLCYSEEVFNGIHCIMGQWNDDRYSRNPFPRWTSDMSSLLGVVREKRLQPCFWMPVPDKPRSLS